MIRCGSLSVRLVSPQVQFTLVILLIKKPFILSRSFSRQADSETDISPLSQSVCHPLQCQSHWSRLRCRLSALPLLPLPSPLPSPLVTNQIRSNPGITSLCHYHYQHWHTIFSSMFVCSNSFSRLFCVKGRLRRRPPVFFFFTGQAPSIDSVSLFFHLKAAASSPAQSPHCGVQWLRRFKVHQTHSFSPAHPLHPLQSSPAELSDVRYTTAAAAELSQLSW